MRTDRLVAFALVAAGVLAAAATAAATQHVTSPEAARAALVEATSQRDVDLAALDGILSSPAATRAAERGVDLRSARRALATLSDAEIRDLAARARAFDRDPASGLSKDANDLLVIFLVVAIVILVLNAVD
jgi:hypothetical protein